MLGEDQPVILHLLDITPALDALEGVKMELDDCAFPLLAGVVCTDDPMVGFKDADYALLVGARPRGPGMERKDLLEANAAIFSVQGKAIDAAASKNIKVLVVGNPANTNALITQRNAPSIPATNFTAMMRLDHNRAKSQLASKTGAAVTDVKNMVVWGNHSATQYPDLSGVTVAGKPALELVEQEHTSTLAYKQRPGHPLLLHSPDVEAVLAAPPETPLRDLISPHLVEVDAPNIALNIDRPEDLRILQDLNLES